MTGPTFSLCLKNNSGRLRKGQLRRLSELIWHKNRAKNNKSFQVDCNHILRSVCVVGKTDITHTGNCYILSHTFFEERYSIPAQT